jgi:nucleoid-associated protein YgaU
VAAPPPDTQYKEEPAPSNHKANRYKVKHHDSLWTISAKPKIYGDAFQWPLIFISNRDQIKDPDVIKPGQMLNIKRDNASDMVADAVKKAKDTPRFEPHVGPREKLPIDY